MIGCGRILGDVPREMLPGTDFGRDGPRGSSAEILRVECTMPTPGCPTRSCLDAGLDEGADGGLGLAAGEVAHAVSGSPEGGPYDYVDASDLV